jgi:hypothetical protein
MTASRRRSARSERELSGTSNKTKKTQLSYPRRREKDVRSLLGVLFLLGSGSVYVSSPRTRVQLPVMSVKCGIT